jgi:hypothetical protein
MAKGTIKRAPKVPDDIPLIGGDELIWPGHRAGMQLRYTTRVDALRPTGYFREVLVTSRHFLRLEHDHHFTTLNDGTRVRDEVRYCLLSPGPAGLLLSPLVRRYLTSRITQRNQVLKAAAESEVWRRYLSGPDGYFDQHANPGHSSTLDKAQPEPQPHGEMAEHRG